MLTKIQIQERAKRKRGRRRGLTQKPGTPPQEYRAVTKPWFKGTLFLAPSFPSGLKGKGTLALLSMLLNRRLRFRRPDPKEGLPKARRLSGR